MNKRFKLDIIETSAYERCIALKSNFKKLQSESKKWIYILILVGILISNYQNCSRNIKVDQSSDDPTATVYNWSLETSMRNQPLPANQEVYYVDYAPWTPSNSLGMYSSNCNLVKNKTCLQGPGYFTNPLVDSPITIKQMKITIDSAPYPEIMNFDIDLDICLQKRTTNPSTGGVVTGDEIVCIKRHKAAGDTQWPSASWEAIFPGQGQIIMPGEIVLCEGQAAISPSNLILTLPRIISNFKCELSFGVLVQNQKLPPPVQSLRVPYMDEFFYGGKSNETYYSLAQTGAVLNTHGFYLNLYNKNGSPMTICLDVIRAPNESPVKTCSVYELGGPHLPQRSYSSPSLPLLFEEKFSPGDRFSMSCTTNSSEVENPGLCSFYTFVDVPFIAGKYVPWNKKQIIPAHDAEKYCAYGQTDRAVFSFSDPFGLKQSTQDGCRQFLEQSIDPPAQTPRCDQSGCSLSPFNIKSGQNITINGLALSLVMQNDGNLVLYKDINRPTQTFLWASATGGRNCSIGCNAYFQIDGNLALYQDGVNYWSALNISNTGEGYKLKIAPGANTIEIIDSTGKIMWHP